jgi:cytochrome c biogenesis protein CcdA
MTGILVPIFFFLVCGAVWITYIYFSSHEKQMMIDKGLSETQIIALFGKKKKSYLLFKLGIITLFTGLGIGLGFLFENLTGSEDWIPFFVVSFVGIGIIIAEIYGRKLEREDAESEEKENPFVEKKEDGEQPSDI